MQTPQTARPTPLALLASVLLALAPRAASAVGPSPASSRTAAPALRYRSRTLRHADGARYVTHVVTVDLCAPGVALRATAPDEGRRTVSAWARRVGASVAINGDFFDTPSHPTPLGPARGHGVDWPTRRQYFFGALLAVAPGERPAVIEGYAHDPRYADIVASQERVVVAGVPHLDPAVVHARERHPRSAIGLTRDGRTMLFVVVDGRSGRSSGITTPELGELMRDLGAWDALRFDGGGSSALYVAGRGVVNHPSDGHERVVANHLGVIVRPADDAVSTLPRFCRDGS